MTSESGSGVPRESGGDAECPPGYPFCCGCGTVFETVEEIDEHDCHADSKVEFPHGDEETVTGEVVMSLPVEESLLEMYGGIYPIDTVVNESGTYKLVRVVDE